MKKDAKIKILGIIPARGGSKRIPHKNVAKIAGRPMIAYAIAAAASSRMLDACIVSTDAPAIATLARRLGADVPFLRPKQFAQDTSPDIAYARHALEWVKKHRGWDPEIVVLLPPDCPTRTPGDIDAAVRLLIEKKYDSVRTIALPVPAVPYKAMWKMRRSGAQDIQPLFPQYVGVPSQSLPEYFISMGLAYVTRAKFIAQGKLWGPKIGGLVIDATRAIEIDDPEQFIRAEKILRGMKKKKSI